MQVFTLAPSGMKPLWVLVPAGLLLAALLAFLAYSAMGPRLTATPELRPSRRTMGTGLPGHQSGWFRLANGEKSLLFPTDRTRTVYIPTSTGFSILVSPSDPDAFLRALRSGK